MDFQTWQKEFDVTKWIDSIIAGEDLCGSYDFCGKCDKFEAFPCAHAYQRYRKRRIRIAILKARPRV